MLSSRRQARDVAANGQVLVIFALFLVVLIGATAIAIDYGSWLKVRRDYQNIADAAVLAGSVYLTRPVDGTKQAQARLAAWKSIEDQLGLTLDEAGLSVSNTAVGTPVTSGGFRLWVSTPPSADRRRIPATSPVAPGCCSPGSSATVRRSSVACSDRATRPSARGRARGRSPTVSRSSPCERTACRAQRQRTSTSTAGRSSGCWTGTSAATGVWR